MRLAERLARLERSQHADPRMSANEIDAAASRYEAELVADGRPCDRSIVEALSTWRRAVERAAEPWLQRVYAGMSPTDLYL